MNTRVCNPESLAGFVEDLLIKGGTWDHILAKSTEESKRRGRKWGQTMGQIKAAAKWLEARGYKVEQDEERVKLTGVDESKYTEAIDDAVVTSFGLERDLQRTLRENIAGLEAGLRIIDGGSEHRCAAGSIDILCEDGQGALVIVELKTGEAKDAALGQVLGYMGAIKHEMTAGGEYEGRPVRGIMVATQFSDRVLHAPLAMPNLRLVSYAVQFTFKDQGPTEGN